MINLPLMHEKILFTHAARMARADLEQNARAPLPMMSLADLAIKRTIARASSKLEDATHERDCYLGQIDRALGTGKLPDGAGYAHSRLHPGLKKRMVVQFKPFSMVWAQSVYNKGIGIAGLSVGGTVGAMLGAQVFTFVALFGGHMSAAAAATVAAALGLTAGFAVAMVGAVVGALLCHHGFQTQNANLMAWGAGITGWIGLIAKMPIVGATIAGSWMEAVFSR
jgi:hypothetical protein